MFRLERFLQEALERDLPGALTSKEKYKTDSSGVNQDQRKRVSCKVAMQISSAKNGPIDWKLKQSQGDHVAEMEIQ